MLMLGLAHGYGALESDEEEANGGDAGDGDGVA